LAAGRRGLAAALLALAALALVLAACDSPGGGPGTGQGVRFVAEDGLVLNGRIYGAPGGAGVVLAHMLDSDLSAWDRFAEHLAARGFQVLSFDFRGHGRSPGEKEVGIADGDVSAAARFLRGNQRRKLFLVGASMGGTASLKVAAREDVLGVVSLSAPASIRGMAALPGAERIAAPKLFIAAEGDGDAVRDARRMFDVAKEPKQIQILPGGAHGTDLLSGDRGDAARDLIVGFLEKNR